MKSTVVVSFDIKYGTSFKNDVLLKVVQKNRIFCCMLYISSVDLLTHFSMFLRNNLTHYMDIVLKDNRNQYVVVTILRKWQRLYNSLYIVVVMVDMLLCMCSSIMIVTLMIFVMSLTIGKNAQHCNKRIQSIVTTYSVPQRFWR